MATEANSRLTPRWTALRDHEGQRRLWHCQARFVGVPAGRGSGKTELAKRRLVRFLPLPKPWSDPRFFYGAPTERQARRVAWQDLIDLIPKPWIADISRSDLRIRLVSGGELWVVGMDSPERIEGVQWDGCVLDESCDLRPGIFARNVLPALSHRSGWCWRIGVPKRQGPGAREFRLFCERAAEGQDPQSAAIAWPSSDILSPEQLAWARANLDAKDYREQFEACWETAGGAIFWAFSASHNVRPCPYDPTRALVVGSDFNVDPMAWVIGQRRENRIEWIDEIWERNTNTQAVLDILWARYGSHTGGFEFYGDASGASRNTSASASDYLQILNDPRFKKAGRTLHYPSSNPAVKDRFAACNALFCNADGVRRMFVAPNCRRLIEDLQSRYYKPGTQEVADSGDLGHITDAMGYPVFRLFPLRMNSEGQRRIVITTG